MATLETVGQFFIKQIMQASYGPMITLLGIYPKEVKTNLYVNVYGSFSGMATSCQQPKCFLPMSQCTWAAIVHTHIHTHCMLQTTELYFLTVLEAASPGSGCGNGWFLLRPLCLACRHSIFPIFTLLISVSVLISSYDITGHRVGLEPPQ
jgi:hypothetical protein